MLSLTAEVAEWFDDQGGTIRHGRAPVEGVGNEALVKAATAAHKASGSSQLACILSLSDGLLRHDLFSIPQLKKSELTKILARKAAKFQDAGKEDVLFSAMSDTGVTIPGQGDQRSWSMVSMNRAEMSGLQLRLRDRGFRVRRVVSGRNAVVETARGALTNPNAAAVLVGIEPASITLTLCHGNAVLNQDTIEGDFLENPSIASSLIHQVKSFIGYWKKESRGEVVGELVMLGLHPDRGQLLRHAFEAALGGVTVLSLPLEADDDLGGRYAYFRAARVVGPLNPDLTVPLQPRKATVTATIAFCLAAVFGGGWLVNDRLGGEAESLGQEARNLERESQSLSHVQQQNSLAAKELDLLRNDLVRTVLVRSHGVPAEDLLEATLRAFYGRASLTDLDVRPGGITGGVEISISGSVNAEPETLLSSLGGLTRSLESSGYFKTLELILPDRMPAPGSGQEIEFQIEGRMEG